MRFYSLMISVLAVWRITHLLHAEDGPGDILLRLRQQCGIGIFRGLMDCFYCLSLWVALPFAAYITYLDDIDKVEWPLLWMALSAGAIFMERIHVRLLPPPIYFEDPLPHQKEDEHVLRNE